MTVPATTPRFAPHEYLCLEAAAEGKHEYHCGEILRTSAGTYRHSTITANLIIVIGIRLKGTGCRVLESNMRVRLAKEDRYVYPDASVVCGAPLFDPLDKNPPER